MARLYKPKYTRPIPEGAEIITKRKRIGGKTVPVKYAKIEQKRGRKTILAEVLEDGQRCRVESERWYGRFTNAAGDDIRVPLATDERVSQRMLADEIERQEREDAGLGDSEFAEMRKPIAEHIADYRKHLESHGRTKKHINKVSYIRRVLAGCGFETLADVKREPITAYLAEQRSRDRWYCPKCCAFFPTDTGACPGCRKQKLKRRPPLSISASNDHITALKSFGNWLDETDRAPGNPFRHLSKLNAEADPRRQRRPASDDEYHRFLTAAAAGEPFRGVSGRDRAILYLLAVNTGLRASELASLTPSSFDLDSESPSVNVKAAYSKRRKNDRQSIRRDVADIMAAWLKEKLGNGLLWPGTWNEKAAVMLRKDSPPLAMPG